VSQHFNRDQIAASFYTHLTTLSWFLFLLHA
jgi:hypothetical protein